MKKTKPKQKPKFTHGAKVVFTRMFERNPSFKINYSEPRDGISFVTSCEGERWRIRRPEHQAGIFIGFRTLSNGPIIKKINGLCGSCGEKSFRVAAVSVDGVRNPIYVQIDSMREV